MEPTTRIELVTSSLPRTRSYQLSYVGPTLERETGIEPATNSLEGCDSTTELLPPKTNKNVPNQAILSNLLSSRPKKCLRWI